MKYHWFRIINFKVRIKDKYKLHSNKSNFSFLFLILWLINNKNINRNYLLTKIKIHDN